MRGPLILSYTFVNAQVLPENFFIKEKQVPAGALEEEAETALGLAWNQALQREAKFLHVD